MAHQRHDNRIGNASILEERNRRVAQAVKAEIASGTIYRFVSNAFPERCGCAPRSPAAISKSLN